MKKTFCQLFVIGLFIMTFTSCEYSPPDIPMTQVQKPSDTGPMVNIQLDPNMDTLKLAASANVSYQIDVVNNKLYQIEFLLDGTDLGLNYTAENSVFANIPASQMTDGLHELKITAYLSTNSGSIADKIGAEAYTYELTWPVVVNNHARDNFGITSVGKVKGGIMINWTKYDYADFVNYKLTRYSSMSGKNLELINTGNPYLNSFVDISYVEGDYFTYYLYSDGLGFSTKDYHEDVVQPRVMINPDFTISAVWGHSKYSQNVKSYYLNTSAPTYGTKENHEITDLQDTTFQFAEKIGFGGNYGVQLKYIPKEFDGYVYFADDRPFSTVALGDSIPAFQRAFEIQGKNSLLMYNNGNFAKYDYETKLTTSGISITPVESPYLWTVVSSANGTYFGYFEDSQFVVRKTSDWSLVKKMNIEAYDGFNFILRTVSLSEDGLVATVDIWNTLRIFDAENGSKILEKKYDNSYFLQNAVLSPENGTIAIKLGNYTDGTTTMGTFKIDSGQLVSLGGISQNGSDLESSFSFSPVTGNLICFHSVGMYKYQVEIRDPNTFEILNSVKIPDFFYPISYDSQNDKVIAQYQFFPIKKYSYLIDVKNGEQKEIVQFVAQGKYVFTNGTVFSGNGRSIKPDEYVVQ